MSVVADVISFLMGALDYITHNALGGLLLGVVVVFLYIRWLKPKAVDMNQVIFKKEFEATAEQQKLPTPKHLMMLSMPITMEEYNKNPIHQIQHNIIGLVVGINVVGVRTSVTSLAQLCKGWGEGELDKFLKENEQSIKDDKLWIVFATKRRVGGILFFTKYMNDLIYVKPNQIISVNSIDDYIRIRGFGLQPQGFYTLVTDEAINTNVKQLMLDKVDVMFDEVGLSTVSRMGDYVTKAMEMDSATRKEAALKGLDVLLPPKSGEVKT
jgi:hypothetical protein